VILLQVAVDGYVIPGIVTLAVIGVGQAVAMWVNVAILRRDMKELLTLHPRQGNPGGLTHDPHQFCANSDCLMKGDQHVEGR
jgi:hypothetical protein